MSLRLHGLGRDRVRRFAPLGTTACALVLALPGTAQGTAFPFHPDGIGPNDQFGYAMDFDGPHLAISAFGPEEVHVWDLDADTLVATLAPNDGIAGDGFGYDVAVDSGRVIVGSPFGTFRNGEAYVFDIASGQQLSKFVAPNSGSILGQSVDVSGDFAVAGAAFDGPGAVYVFEATTGAQLHALTGSGSRPGDLFGANVATDGDHVLVGAPSAGNFAGVVYLFDLTTGQEIRKWVGQPSESIGFRLALEGHVGAISLDDGPGGVRIVDVSTGAVRFDLIPALVDTEADDFPSALDLENGQLLAGGSGADASMPGVPTGAAWLFDAVNGQELEAFWDPLGQGLDGLGDSVALANGVPFAGAPGAESLAPDGGDAFLLGPAPFAYCTAKVNGLGCTPAIASTGTPSTQSPLFEVTATNVLNGRNGLLLYGANGATAQPFVGGTLCVAPPLSRSAVQDSGGNSPPDDCSGAYLLDFNTLLPANPLLQPGTTVNAQWWSRDPLHPDGSGSSLSNALEFLIGT